MKKMFSLQQANELVFQNPSISLQQLRILQDLIHHDSSDPTSTVNNCSTRKRCRQLTTTTATGDPLKKEESNIIADADDDDDRVRGHGYNDKKRMMHREIEKQRRQDMAKLYSSLRSLLPLEFIKGKRSIPDHMQQAVNYIKQKEQNIKHFRVKRDELKNTFNTSVFPGDKNNLIIVGKSSNNRVPNRVTVSPCLGGAEIIINSGYIGFQPEFLLSRLLQVIYQHGFNVVSYTSSKVNERLLLTIQSEVSDLTSNRLSVLQQELSDVVHA